MAQKSSQNLNISDNTNCFNNVIHFNTAVSDEDNQIREWLSPLTPHQRHQDVRAERLDGVGDRFLDTSEFRKWSKGEDGSRERVLFCSGGPGVGKTYLWYYKNIRLVEKGVKEDVTDKYKILVP